MTSRSSRSGRGAAGKRHSSSSTANSFSRGKSKENSGTGASARQGKSKTAKTAHNHRNQDRQQTTQQGQSKTKRYGSMLKNADVMPKDTHRSSASKQASSNRKQEEASTQPASSKSTGVHVPVLYEDNHVIGVVKPVNIPSQADDTGDEDMLALIKQDLKQRHQKEGNVFLGLVHRLDRPVGGAMLFAKTSKGASRLSDSVRNDKLSKRYVAVLRGIPSRPHATLKDTLLKDSRTNTSTVVAPGTPGGKDAVLDYEILATDEQANLSLALIKLHTGRSHQIRVQMAHAGHPLFGDQRYGSELNRPGEQLALWSVLAAAPHPVKDETIRIMSLPPRLKPWTQWSEAVYEKLVQRLDDEQA